MRRFLLIVVWAFFCTTGAHADCDESSSFIGSAPIDGATVPTNAVMHVRTGSDTSLLASLQRDGEEPINLDIDVVAPSGFGDEVSRLNLGELAPDADFVVELQLALGGEVRSLDFRTSDSRDTTPPAITSDVEGVLVSTRDLCAADEVEITEIEVKPPAVDDDAVGFKLFRVRADGLRELRRAVLVVPDVPETLFAERRERNDDRYQVAAFDVAGNESGPVDVVVASTGCTATGREPIVVILLLLFVRLWPRFHSGA